MLERHYEAVGGLENIKSVASRRLTGRMTIGPGMEAPITVRFKRPAKLRLDFIVQGVTGSRAYDGKKAWMMMPFLGQTVPTEMPADQAQNLIRQADFDGPLVDWKEKGIELELVGIAQFDGRPTYKVKIVEADGSVSFQYLDRESFLSIGREGRVSAQSGDVEFTSKISDYRKVGRLNLPHSFENREVGAQQVQRIIFDKIELNVDIADEAFAMPQ